MNSASNVSLEDHLTNIITKVTTPNANHQGPSNGEPKKHKVKPIKKTNDQLKKNSKNKDESSIKEKVMWDSLSLNDKDDDNEDDEVIFVPTTPTNPSPDNADSEPAVDTETYQASAGTADNTEMTIAERQLAELLAGSKRGKGKGAKNQGTSKNSGKPNEKVPTLRRRVNFSNPIVLKAIAEVLESKKQLRMEE